MEISVNPLRSLEDGRALRSGPRGDGVPAIFRRNTLPFAGQRKKRFGSNRPQRKAQVVVRRNSPAKTRRRALSGYFSRFAAVRVRDSCCTPYVPIPRYSTNFSNSDEPVRAPHVSGDLNSPVFHFIFGCCYGCSRGWRLNQTSTRTAVIRYLRRLSWSTPRPRLKKTRP